MEFRGRAWLVAGFTPNTFTLSIIGSYAVLYVSRNFRWKI